MMTVLLYAAFEDDKERDELDVLLRALSLSPRMINLCGTVGELIARRSNAGGDVKAVAAAMMVTPKTSDVEIEDDIFDDTGVVFYQYSVSFLAQRKILYSPDFDDSKVCNAVCEHEGRSWHC